MIHSTPSKQYIKNIKEELSNIASITKQNPHLGSPGCINSIKSIEKIVSNSTMNRLDKKQINSHLDSIQRSLSPQKNIKGGRKLSSTLEQSDRTHKKQQSSSKKSKYHKQNLNKNESDSVSLQIYELQMRNKMLQDQIKSYKIKVKEARKIMLHELQQNKQQLTNYDNLQNNSFRKQIMSYKKQIRHLTRQNQQYKQSLEESQERINQLMQENKYLKQKLKDKSRQKQRLRIDEIDQKRLDQGQQIQRLKNQIQRLKIQKQSFDKKSTLLSSNQKLKQIVKRYKQYL